MDKVKELTGIYHEHQEGALCAQHALNNLLQNQVFLADALADIARELDIEEISVLAQDPVESENMDDTGFFSIQVLQRALKIFDIELVPYASQDPIAKQARANPETIQAYICNLGLHWFTIRRFGRQYFDLNSFFYVPELISNAVLTSYINLIQQNGYSIFIVHGNLSECKADEQLTANPINPETYRSLIKDLPKFVMDGKLPGNSKDPHNRRVVVRIPKHIYDEYMKNPNDPNIRRKIEPYIPQHILEGGFLGNPGCPHDHHHHHKMTADFQDDIFDEDLIDDLGCSHHHHHQPTMSADFLGDFMDEKLMHGPCCSYHHHQMTTDLSKQKTNEQGTTNRNILHNQPPIFTEQSKQFMIDDPLIGDVSGPYRRRHIIATRLTIGNPSMDNQNAAKQHPMMATRQIYIMNGFLREQTSQMHKELDDFTQEIEKNREKIAQTEEKIFQVILAQSLLETQGTNGNKTVSSHEDQTEKINQMLLDDAIAASLTTNNSVTKQPEETPELIPITTVTSPSIPTMNSEPLTITNPLSSITTEPPSPKIINPPPPTTTNPLVPTTATEPPSSTITNSPPSTAPNSPLSTTTEPLSPAITNPPASTTTYSPPHTPTDSKSVEPSIEELRQRRLQTNNNRDRSIISKQSSILLND